MVHAMLHSQGVLIVCRILPSSWVSRIVVVDQVLDTQDELLASVVYGLIKLPVWVLQCEITVQFVDLLQKQLYIGFVRVT